MVSMQQTSNLRYAFFPGCVSKGACHELFLATNLIKEKMQIEFVELTQAACTGAGVTSAADPHFGVALNARTLAMAEKLGLDLVTQCSTCQGVLAGVNVKLQQDPPYRERINKILRPLGYEYNGGVKVKHLLWVIVEDVGLDHLKSLVTNPLTGIKIGAFYGCYILRPSESLGFDDPANPSSMEKVIAALGAQPVFYEGRNQCCGFPLQLINPHASFAQSGKHLWSAQQAGAQVIVTPCPLCHLSLDARQPDAKKAVKQPLHLPIVHLSQLVGLAFGFGAKDLGLHRHVISTNSFLNLIPDASKSI